MLDPSPSSSLPLYQNFKRISRYYGGIAMRKIFGSVLGLPNCPDYPIELLTIEEPSIDVSEFRILRLRDARSDFIYFVTL